MRKKRHCFLLDAVEFRVQGKALENFLTAAAASKMHLRSVRRTQDDIVAKASGREYAKLCEIAWRSGWNIILLRRIGPGRTIENIVRRPGLAVGFALFFALCQCFEHVLWHIDFGKIEDVAMQQRLLTQLHSEGIWEGAIITQPMLAEAQTYLMAESTEFGWLSLNFEDGCLFFEQAPIQYQGQKQAPQEKALVAADDAYLISFDIESGFVEVHPEQTVKKGQLLVDSQRADRDGDAVVQPARGKVMARIIKSYTAAWPFEKTVAESPTGHLAWHSEWQCGPLNQEQKNIEIQEKPFAHFFHRQEYTPLQLGRISLPVCLTRNFYIETAKVKYRYSKEQAELLARRSCRLALRKEYPDAVIEQMQQATVMDENGVTVKSSFVFVADVARSGARSEGIATQENQ